ncbi:pectinesterase-like [Neltuma alba]|uniref:pectinesterase-like n=1 Tax=Neltuma alba TaxID=207710 RepID=UPI0010A536C2|nr:pectinesterase-like [Prosopis alba]
MAFKLMSLFSFTGSVFLLLSFFALLSLAADNPVATLITPPDTVCDSTLHPSLCKTVLGNQNGNVFDFGRILLRRSLSQSRTFLNQVNSILRSPSSLSQPTIRALEDCRFLAELNFQFLSDTLDAVKNLNDFLSSSKAEDLETLFSAVLTNQQTCQDGLETTTSDRRVKDDLSSSLSDDTKLHSVSLALFAKGWVPEKKIITSWPRNGRHLEFSNGRLPLKMSPRVKAIFDSAKRHGRKLLQSDDESVSITDIVVVSQDGSGNFSTINDAINAAPNNTAAGNGYFLIFITEGVYQEYVSIAKNKKYLMLVGEGINRTIITGDHNVVDGSTTFNSATFAVVAEGFVAVNITFRNTAGPSKHQAVALRSGADKSTFYSCSFEGYQDTLYTHSMRQFYRECDIYGTVDFIFGNGAVVLQNCNLYPRLPMSGQFNAITAQGRTDPNQNTGTSIQNATIKAADDLAPSVGSVKTYLGRPWKEYSRTVFMESWMDSLINPAGWREWNGDFALSTLYYAEYNNSGPGANTSNRVTWPGYHVINATDAANFTVSNFLTGDAWLPQTGVPYSSGLAA